MQTPESPKPPFLSKKAIIRTACLLTIGTIFGVVATTAIRHASESSKVKDKTEVAATTAPQLDPDQSAAASSSNPYSESGMAPSWKPMTEVTTNGTGYYPATSNVPAGRDIEYMQNSSGYTVYTGRKAVDSDQPVSTVGSGAAIMTDPAGNPIDVAPPPIMRNGLRGNPCVDPPSTFGAAYGRNKAQ